MRYRLTQRSAATQAGLTQALAAMKIFALCLVLTLSACATSTGQRQIYFPELSDQTTRLDTAALREILDLSQTTLPGEQLEELAELASSYVKPRTLEFLQAQPSHEHCFGASFLGPKFTDDTAARKAELLSRRKALAAVSDPTLVSIRDLCLASLPGS